MENIIKFNEFINESLTNTNFQINIGWAIRKKIKEQIYNIARQCNVNITMEKISGHIKVKYNVNVVGEESDINIFINNIQSTFSRYSKSGEEEWIDDINVEVPNEVSGEEEPSYKSKYKGYMPNNGGEE